jgi:hypothetical protein
LNRRNALFLLLFLCFSLPVFASPPNPCQPIESPDEQFTVRLVLDRVQALESADISQCQDDTLNKIIDWCLEAGEVDLAARICKVGKTAPAGMPKGLVSRCGKVYAMLGDLAEASKTLEIGIKSHVEDSPEQLKALLDAAQILEDSYRFGVAADFLGRADKKAQTDREIALKWLKLLIESGQNQQAADAALLISQQQPELAQEMAKMLLQGGAAASALNLIPVLLKTASRADLDIVVSLLVASDKTAEAKEIVHKYIYEGPQETLTKRIKAGAEILGRHGNAKEGAEEIQALLEKSKARDPELLELMGKLFLKAGQLEAGSAALKEAFGGFQKDYVASKRIASSLRSYQRHADAAEILSSTENVPADKLLEVTLLVAKAWRDAGQLDKEQTFLEDRAKGFENQADFWLSVADSQKNSAKYELAIKSYERVKGLKSKGYFRCLAALGIADSLIAMGSKEDRVAAELDEAISLMDDSDLVAQRFETFAKKLPTDSKYSSKLLFIRTKQEPRNPDLWQQIAELSLKQGRVIEALDAYEQAVRWSAEPGRMLGQATLKLADAKYLVEAGTLVERLGTKHNVVGERVGQFTGLCIAIKVSFPVLTFHVKHFFDGPIDISFNYLEAGRQLMLLGLYDLAEQSLQLADKLPGLSQEGLLVEKGRLELLKNNISGASEYFEKAIKQKDAAIAAQIGTIWRDYGYVEKAIPAFWQAILLGGNMEAVDAWMNALISLGKRQDITKLGKIFKELASYDGFSSLVFNLIELGLSQFALDQVNKLDSSPANVRFALSLALDEPDKLKSTCLQPGAPNDECSSFAYLLMTDGKISETINILKNLAKSKSSYDSGNALLMQAFLLSSTGDHKEALRVAKDAISLGNVELASIIQLIKNMKMAGYWEYANELLEKGLEIGLNDDNFGPELMSLKIEIDSYFGKIDQLSAALDEWFNGEIVGYSSFYTNLIENGLPDLAERILQNLLTDFSVDAFDGHIMQQLMEIIPDLVERGRVDLAKSLFGFVLEATDNTSWILTFASRFLSNKELIKLYDSYFDFDMTIDSPEFIGLLAATGEHERVIQALGKGSDFLSFSDSKAKLKLAWNLIREGVPKTVVANFLVPSNYTRSQGGFTDISDPKVFVDSAYLRLSGASEVTEELLSLTRGLLLAGFGYGAQESAADYIRLEAALGTIDGLFDLVANVPTPEAAHLRLFTACIANDKKLEKRALEINRNSSNRALILMMEMDAYYACGQWKKAYEKAQAFFKADTRVVNVDEVISKYTRVSEILGQKGAKWLIPRLEKKSDSKLALLDQKLRISLSTGDYRGATELNLAKLELYPGNPSYLADALEAALRSADEGLIKGVLGEMIPNLKNGFKHEENLKTLLNRYFREDLLVPTTNGYLLGAIDDFALALNRYLASLETNDYVLISSSAAAIIKDKPVNEDMLALVVMAAAQKLVPSLVDLYLPQLLAVAKRPLSVKALLAAAELKFMLGDAETATQLLEKAAVLTTDPIGLAITAATDSLLNPLLPVDLGEKVLKIRDYKEGSNYHSEIKKLPTVFASSCLGLAKTESQVAACAEVLDSLQVRAGLLLLDGATRAMSLQKFDAAGYMIKQALTRETGAVFASYVAYKVVDAIGDKYEVKDLEARKRLAQIALDANPKIDDVIDKDFDIFRRLLTEAVDSAETAFGSHQNPMISAWNASALNSRAYAMSMVGYNLKEALEIVRLAEKLGPEENGYYLETEAWIHFRMGDLKKALQLQLRAKPLWNRKMGSGVSESYGHLGEIYEASGKLKEAIDAYRTAVISSSDSEWKRRALRNWARLNHPN